MISQCNQCSSEMFLVFQTDVKYSASCYVTKISVYACNNPACPNFGVLQLPLKDIPQEKGTNEET